ncbi:MAG: BTAD domain-containing putative transcriptional regulator [Anaerolineae bacterium]
MTEHLTIRLLGSVQIELAGKPVTELSSRKAEALFIFLACQQRPFSREALADLLWDDRPKKQALANLRSILSNLRRQLDPYLAVTRQTVSFNHESDVWLDVHAFTAALDASEAHPHLNLEECEACIHRLETAVDLYRGRFLEGFIVGDSAGYEEWRLLNYERYQRRALMAFHHLTRYYAHRGIYGRALAYAQRQVELEPYREEAHRALMNILARSGQRSAALAQYEACRRILSEELGVEPTPQTQALYQRIRSAGEARPHNLPSPLPPLIGREKELHTVGERLANPDCHLITLTGPGGIGKTRLALQTAAEQIGLFLHGVFFVPLAAVDSPDILGTAIAEAVHCPLKRQSDVQTQLLDHLREKEILLVMDNFEHLLGGVSWITRILHAAPHLKLLVTSRERLNLQAEWVVRLEGLSHPPDVTAVAPNHLPGFKAIQLFVGRARQVAAGFAPSGDEYHHIARICCSLRGIPLGIELAAGLADLYPCSVIADEIETSLDFLASPLRDVPERHRSLRAVMEQSWRLLPAAEQEILRKFAVFTGSFQKQAAADITGATPRQLQQLVNKSFLQVLEAGRYELHPLTRHFLDEKLAADAAVSEAVFHRHAAFYMNFLTKQGSGEETEERAAIRAEVANIRAALRWAARRQDVEMVAQAAPILHNFYTAQSWFQEGVVAFQFAIEQFSGDDDFKPEQAALLCDLLGRKARMHIFIGQIKTARSILAIATTYLKQVDSAARRSTMLGYLAITTYYAGEYTRAAELATESLRLSQEMDDQNGIAFALNFLGSCAKAQGDYDKARRRFEAAVQAFHRLEDGIGAAMALNNLGNLAQATGDFAAAQKHYRECSDLFKANDHIHGAATTLANAGQLALKMGDRDKAKELLTESLALKQEIHDQRGTAVALVSLAEVSLATGKYGQMREQLAQAFELSQQSGDIKLMLEVLMGVGALAMKQESWETAARLLVFAQNHKAASQEILDWGIGLLAQMRDQAAQNGESIQAAEADGKTMNLETAVVQAQAILHAG